MASMQAGKLAKATAFFLQNPNASIADCEMATGFSNRTCAQARSNLAAKGLMTSGRNRKPREPRPDEQGPIPTEAPNEGPTAPGSAAALPDGTLLDDAGMRALADPNTGFLADLDLDDEETRKKLLREVKRIAFDAASHPDTRLSATQVWLKLKDMAKTRELGPGVPLTRVAAIARLKDLISAVGLEMALEALLLAFGIARLVAALYKLTGMETTDGQSPETVEQGEPAPAPALPARPTAGDDQAGPQA